jgi:hypothetical protein
MKIAEIMPENERRNVDKHVQLTNWPRKKVICTLG